MCALDGGNLRSVRGPSGVVCVIAVTDEGRLLLVEQFRPPVDTTVIELPAGLAGDLDEDPEESLQTAARRELLEETGYEASTWTHLCDVTSSSGLTDEVVSIFRAENLHRAGPGGGDDSEAITVHEVETDRLLEWLTHAVARGARVDSRVYAVPTLL